MTIQQIVVVGAGTMGHGIAQAAAQSGYGARLCDVDAKAVAAFCKAKRVDLVNSEGELDGLAILF